MTTVKFYYDGNNVLSLSGGMISFLPPEGSIVKINFDKFRISEASPEELISFVVVNLETVIDDEVTAKIYLERV